MEQPSLSRGVVSDGILLYQEGVRKISLSVDSPAWYSWLEQARSFSFRGDEGTFTAHKARPGHRRGSWYWYAYLRRHGQLFRLYLGASSSLTLECLHDAARQLLRKAGDSSERSADLSRSAKNGSRTTFLITKFHIPRPPIHYIARSRLLAELDQGAQTRLTLVSAPAGSGKTTLLSAWARATAFPVAWLSLEVADDDPQRFLSILLAAIKFPETQPGEQDVARRQVSREQAWEEVLTRFANELGTLLTRDTIVILDDYHLLSSELIHTALRFLVEHAPPQLHLIIGTRNDPPFPLARLRARGQLHELRTEALCFVSAEVESFVYAMGLTLSGEATGLLEQRTEGWIAGIQLLTLALRGHADATTFLRASGQTHHFLLDYMSEEILAQQTPEIQHFLLRTCVLERFTGPLCDAVTEEHGGQEKLATLRRANLFVSALDDTQTWYRYHPLFAEALRTHLQKQEPGLIPELYLRASQWYEQHQREEEACDYALLAGDFPRVANLAAGLLPRLVEQGRFARLGQWLSQLPPTLIATSPQLYVVTPWLYAASRHLPEDTEQVLTLMQQHVQKQQLDTEVSWVEPQSVLALFQAITELSQNNLPRALMLARKALRILGTRETSLSQLISRFLRISLSIMYGANGDLVAAEQILLDLSRVQPTEAFSLIQLAAPFLLGELYRAQGKLHKGEALYENLFQMVGGHRDMPPMPLLVLGFSLMRKASLWYEWNRLPEAAHEIRQVLDMFSRALPEIIPRANRAALFAFGLWAQARIEWAQGSPEAASYFLELVRSQPEMGELPPGKDHPPVDVFSLAASLALLCGRNEEAVRWANTCGIGYDDKPATLLESRQIFAYLTLARVLIAQGRSQRTKEPLSQALILLGHWRKLAERVDFQGWLLEIQMLTALALQAQGSTRQALTTLGPVLALAEAEGYMRLFVDAGQPMAHLLAQISAYTTASHGYIQRLQTALSSTSLLNVVQIEAPQAQLDPLSEREREVLSLLASGTSNQQIAERLVISLNTAKRHVKNILAKLAVTNRTQAVARARELHLL
ncbi:MAG TPA: LuxR C-terminal-related transcriptional regulator [Ktedonobacteraceae bacterium]|nr:LuxR C-terminal-related transcriptional regulator [Ktedonobacteraceae bacterium]